VERVQKVEKGEERLHQEERVEKVQKGEERLQKVG